jgi:hypothetical protein
MIMTKDDLRTVALGVGLVLLSGVGLEMTYLGFRFVFGG